MFRLEHPRTREGPFWHGDMVKPDGYYSARYPGTQFRFSMDAPGGIPGLKRDGAKSVFFSLARTIWAFDGQLPLLAARDYRLAAYPPDVAPIARDGLQAVIPVSIRPLFRVSLRRIINAGAGVQAHEASCVAHDYDSLRALQARACAFICPRLSRHSSWRCSCATSAMSDYRAIARSPVFDDPV